MKRVIIAAIAGMMLGILSAIPAFADGPQGTGVANLHQSPDYRCSRGATDTGREAGWISIFHIPHTDEIRVDVVIWRAKPDTTYDIWVNQFPDTCQTSAPTGLDGLTTNSMGKGKTKIILTDTGSPRNWVSVVGGGLELRSPTVRRRRHGND